MIINLPIHTYFSLRVLGWQIPGLSTELPLGHRLLPLLAGESPFFLYSSFVLCACVYPERGTAGEPGAVAGVSGCWRVSGEWTECGRRFVG